MVLKCFKSSERPSDSQGRSPAKPMPFESRSTATTNSSMNGQSFISILGVGALVDEEDEAVLLSVGATLQQASPVVVDIFSVENFQIE